MTKEELVTECIEYVAQWMSYRDAMDLSYIFDKFFSQNVVIPKGENRHPDADIIHDAIEGHITIEVQMTDGTWEECYGEYSHEYKHRIKPSEPIYEWQWMYKFKNGNEFQFTGYETEDEVHHFMSQLDKDSIGHYATKIEETKRERKQ